MAAENIDTAALLKPIIMIMPANVKPKIKIYETVYTFFSGFFPVKWLLSPFLPVKYGLKTRIFRLFHRTSPFPAPVSPPPWYVSVTIDKNWLQPVHFPPLRKGTIRIFPGKAEKSGRNGGGFSV